MNDILHSSPARADAAGAKAEYRPAQRKYWTKTLASACIVLLYASPAFADGPGRGATAQFEKAYLTHVINHHYSALRITELAAGTDTQRDPQVNNPEEGTSPTPGTTPTQAKAGMEEIKSMARSANRMQREEIGKAQRLLREWYGVNHTPTLSAEGQRQIQLLEQTSAGAPFEQKFLQVFSNHHVVALHSSLDGAVNADVDHHALKDYCTGVVQNQLREIDEMRTMLCKHFSLCDFQPAKGAKEMSGMATGAMKQ